MERIKMSRADRAKQFAPFDALKGLQQALRQKEYEHDKSLKKDITEEKADELSTILNNIEKNSIYDITYFYDGYNQTTSGKIKYILEEQCIKVTANNQDVKINLNDIIDIKINEGF